MAAVAWVVREVTEGAYGSIAAGGTDSDVLAEAGAVVDPDAIDDLGDEIVSLAENIHAATQRFLKLVAQFDRLRGWERAGQKSCADWLAWRCGIDHGTAREKVRTARALRRLPLIDAAMARGELSFSQARTLTRKATPEDEPRLLELARGLTVGQLERVMRAYYKGQRQDEVERERERYESRSLAIFPDDDGMYVIRGRLPPEIGALLMRAIEAAGDTLHREHRESPGCGLRDPAETRREAVQRRADALGLLAERAMAAGFEDPPVCGSRADRYQVVLHVDEDTLAEDGEVGRSELEDGTRVSYEASRRVACDAAVVEVREGAGSVFGVGRKTRTIPPALRRALEVRDRGCRFPGCGLRFTEAHHVKHWADGGETSLDNCLLLCRYHHRLVHECGWRVGFDDERRPLFFDARGGMHYDGRWQPPATRPTAN